MAGPEAPVARAGPNAADPPPNRWLPFARTAWLVLAACVLGLYAFGVPIHFAELQEPCPLLQQACAEAGLLNLTLTEQLQALGLTTKFWAGYIIALNLGAAAVSLAISGVIVARLPNNGMALFVAFMLLTFSTGTVASEPLAALARAHPAWRLPTEAVFFLGNAGVALWAYIFPDGRFVPGWSRWLAAAWILISVPVHFFPDSAFNYQNHSEAIDLGVFVGFLVTFVMAQVTRYRRVSTPAQRQQTKWVVFGVVAAIVGFLAPILAAVAYPEIEQQIVTFMLLNAVIYLALTLIPISFGIAILRSRLWDIDFLIRRTLVYSALSAMLALVYVASVAVLQNAVRLVTGRSQSELITVVSTLIIAALFLPLRARTQQWIDRRFYRRKYDAAKTLAAFSASVRDETDLEHLTGDLVQVVDDTLQSSQISLWLKRVDRIDR
jgi:hypothetical protein